MNKLLTPVSALEGVGPKRVQALNQLGIQTIADLLYYFPFRYDDLQVKDINEIADQEKVTLKGVVVADPVISRFGRRKTRLNVRILIEHQAVQVTFFNQPYLRDKFETGDEVAIYGKWDAKRKSMTGMKVLASRNGTTDSFQPIYSASKEIKPGTIVNLIRQAYDQYHDDIKPIIPEWVVSKYRLMPEEQMVKNMHFPDSKSLADSARRTAIFREFFLFESQMQAIKQDQKQPENGLELKFDNQALKAFISTLKFELTGSQKRVVNEICLDLKSTSHMNRLLQGDVGSGKTIVAAITMFAAITAGYQAALMVPTEILAEQHFESLTKLLEPQGVKLALLTGNTTTKERKTILSELASGRINLIIGTHALIQTPVKFHKLGFIVIDEQHRFGVNQRTKLREKGNNPDVLAMTATPIPRTLAITTYGEMDVSTIDEMPKGRMPVQTSWVRSNQMPLVLRTIKDQLDAKGQVFVITPLIAESEQMDLKNAEEIYNKMSAAFSGQYQVSLLHGQMKNDEKEAVMRDFTEDKTQLLVSTTVVEVGVDVPKATLMVIFDADRFGLAQLHQLRGRVGRSSRQSYCVLIADPKNQTGIERMVSMTETNNGFELAQKDLELRGSGDVFGQRQSGMPEFKVGDPVSDFPSLQVANQVANEIFQIDPNLTKQENAGLKSYLDYRRVNVVSFD